MSFEEVLSPIDSAAEDGDFETVRKLVEQGVTREDLEQAMDTAYRGTKVQPAQEGCIQIVSYLASLGIDIPTYPFQGKRISFTEFMQQQSTN